jgi:hypothetical protein
LCPRQTPSLDDGVWKSHSRPRQSRPLESVILSRVSAQTQYRPRRRVSPKLAIRVSEKHGYAGFTH